MEPGARHGSRMTVGVDVDGTLTNAGYVHGVIAPPSDAGLQLLRMLKGRGYSVLLFTGHINEDDPKEEQAAALTLVEQWVDKYGLRVYVDRVWPYPKPHWRCLIDDRASRFRGDPEMCVLEADTALEYCDSLKEKSVV